MFKKATRIKSKLRMALIGPSGSGKTYSALKLANGLGTKIAVIDTEHGSASKYNHISDFDVLELSSFNPQNYINAIEAAGKEGYEVLIIDSLSHAWIGKDGALELVDNESKRSKSGNSFTAWRAVTPLHNKLVETMISCKCHLIVTMRAKTEYVMETNSNGKQAPRKVGLAPIQRDGMEYEFDVVADMDLDNNLMITKSRCDSLHNKVMTKPTEELGKSLLSWVTEGEDPPEPPKLINEEQINSIVDLFACLNDRGFTPLPNHAVESKRWDFITKIVKEKAANITEEKADEIISWMSKKNKMMEAN